MVFQHFFTLKTLELYEEKQHKRMLRTKTKMPSISIMPAAYREKDGEVDCEKLEKILRMLVLMEKPKTSRPHIFTYLDSCLDKSETSKYEGIRKYYEEFLKKHGLEMESETEALTRRNTWKTNRRKMDEEMCEFRSKKEDASVMKRRVRISELADDIETWEIRRLDYSMCANKDHLLSDLLMSS